MARKRLLRPENQSGREAGFSIVIDTHVRQLAHGHAFVYDPWMVYRWGSMRDVRHFGSGTDKQAYRARRVVEQLKKDDKEAYRMAARVDQRPWAWKEQYGTRYRAKCDGMECSRMVTPSFYHGCGLHARQSAKFCTLYEEGQIYRGIRIVMGSQRPNVLHLEVKKRPKDGKYLFNTAQDTDRTITVAQRA